MHKVVVERPRGRSSGKSRKWGKRIPFLPDAEYEDQPKFVSSSRRRQYGSNCKWFTDVLGPLAGYLRSNVGRPWNKVYSELRQGLDVRKVTGLHIFDHLKRMVETDFWIGPDREVHARSWKYRIEGSYVHPETGLLCFVQGQTARQRKKESLLRQTIDEVKLDRCQSYRLIGGLWYWVVHEYLEVERGTLRSCWDVIDRREVKLTRERWRAAVSKRRCNSEEVKWIRERPGGEDEGYFAS